MSDPGPVARPRWSPRLQQAGRVAWVVFSLLALAYFLAELGYSYGALLQPSPALEQNLARLGLSAETHAVYLAGARLLFMLVHVLMAGFIVWRRPDEPIALFVASAFVLMGTSIWPFPPVSFPERWQGVRATLHLLSATSFILFFFIFPDGKFTPRWTGPFMLAVLALEVGLYYLPGTPLDASTWPRPLSAGISLAVMAAMVAAQVYRYRRVSNATLRQQTKWVVFGTCLTFAGYFLVGLPGALGVLTPTPGSAYGLFSGSAIAALFLLIPLSIGVAVLRYRLWDIDLFINRALVYGALTAITIGVYALTVGYIATLFRTSANFVISLIAAGLVAVLFQPLRERLQRAVNRLMYGERHEPAAVLARLSQRLEAALAPASALPTIVETVAQALRLPYAAVTVQSPAGAPEVAAETGQPQAEVIRLPLSYQSQRVGELLLAPRARGEAFSTADERLLAIVAQQAGVIAHDLRLAGELRAVNVDLQRSRERLVTAQEEERRRLRRDLHDGVGPTLASLLHRLDTAADLAGQDPAASVALLVDLKGQVKATIAEIRRLVYALRPPALDEFGLVTALREHLAPYSRSALLRLTFTAPEALPPLPAAVEVAAYRIVLEAFTNVVRHARASACNIVLALDADALSLEVADDGLGMPRDAHWGVGLTSLRERAAELGGTCLIEAPPGGGTRIRARLPLPPVAAPP